MQIKWDENLNTGDRELDVHHQAFFVKAQEIADACRGGRGADVVGEMLGFVTEYAQHHFKAEEERMTASAYPYARTHLDQHAGFLAKIEELKEKLELKGPSPQLADDVRDAVIGWLQDHIKGSDMPLVEFIRNQKGDADS